MRDVDHHCAYHSRAHGTYEAQDNGYDAAIASTIGQNPLGHVSVATITDVGATQTYQIAPPRGVSALGVCYRGCIAASRWGRRVGVPVGGRRRLGGFGTGGGGSRGRRVHTRREVLLKATGMRSCRLATRRAPGGCLYEMGPAVFRIRP